MAAFQEKSDDPRMTSPTLLARLQSLSDHAAWEAFYERYWRLIVSFAMKRGCSEAMSHDVLQETMFILMRVMADFTYDRSQGQFRSYLAKIVDYRIKDAQRRERKYINVDPDQQKSAIQETRHDFKELWDKEWTANLVHLALERVNERLTPVTAESFRMYVMEQMPAEEVAKCLGIKANAVYQHKARVLSLLETEIKSLEREESLI